MYLSPDFVVIGGGIAGLRAAIALAPAGRVLILTKGEPTESNTGYAQGGIAVALGSDDSPALHAADTIRAGDGLCDEDAVRVLVEEGPPYVQELVDWGTRFDREPDGELSRGREAAHSVRRVLHAGDATGREIARLLWTRVSSFKSVEIANHALVTELLVEHDRCAGVRFYDQNGFPRDARAKATLLATGGAGQVFRHTTNPRVATGDGVALGFHAGARVADLEFVQFHPTALNVPGAPRFLISEALRGDGAKLINARGETFMTRYHPDGDLAPRDVVARSIMREMETTGGAVFLSLSHLDPDYVVRRFPTIADMCRQIRLDLARDPIPISPAAHYVMGGVNTDVWGRTSLKGLFAAGEVACTGVHGANRLASNSLLEGLVFGARAALAMREPPQAAPLASNRRAAPATPNIEPRTASLSLTTTEVRDLMWKSVGLFRTREGLEDAVAKLDASYAAHRDALANARADDGDAWKQFNLVTVARLIARAALRRLESRGAHYRADFPEHDDVHWKAHIVDTL
ncbi:MAG TPA: L-aspartate oxidase [Vicinamibacterales bacterium]|nr:L-aspartate oxidase [Vicinamibacterales bacterium]